MHYIPKSPFLTTFCILTIFEFEVKKTKYFTSGKGTSSYALTSQVLNEKEWTPQILEARQKKLLEVLKQSWKLDDNFSEFTEQAKVEEEEILKKRSRNLTFKVLNIPNRAELTFFKNRKVKCIVKDRESTVIYKGEEYTLSGLALQLLHEMGFKWKTARGADHFMYMGTKLSDMPH